jgi:hypothetical protein
LDSTGKRQKAKVEASTERRRGDSAGSISFADRA